MIVNNGGNGNGNGNGKVPPGLHFLKALGHAALAWGHIAFAGDEGDDNEEGENSEKRRPRRPGVRKKSCCLGRR